MFLILNYYFYSELECVPDIYSLIEWSNWLTPWRSPRRYDTIFYLVCLDEKPKMSADRSEITETIVSTIIIFSLYISALQLLCTKSIIIYSIIFIDSHNHFYFIVDESE